MPRRSKQRAPDRARSTRARLLRAGRRAFARKGLAATNLREDVLAPAGISVGSFYHQFEDKTELLLAVLEEGRERLEPRLLDVFGGRPRRSRPALARRFYAALLDWSRRNRDLWRIAARERFGDEPRVRRALDRQRERWVDCLAQALEAVPAPGGGRPRRVASDARRLAEWMVRIGHAAADEQVLGKASRKRVPGGVVCAELVALTLQGAPGLGPRPRPAARARRG